MKNMKNETQNEKLAKSQNRQGIKEVFSGYHQSKLRVPSKTVLLQSPLLMSCIGKPEAFSPLAGHGGSFILGKGPPGKSHSPGVARGHPPAEKTDKPANKAGPPGHIVEYNNEYQQINTNQNSNYYKHLNFKIMKKQILFIVVFVLAAFANVNKSYGQCVSDPLHPAAGVPYDYEVTISGTTGTSASSYIFYVTKDKDIIGGTKETAGADFAATGTGFATYNTAGSIGKIQLTWTSSALASTTPYYLVVRYSETSATECTVQNIRVWMINPVNSFLLATVGSDLGGDDTKASACPADLLSANVSTDNTKVTYVYGSNTLYYKVTASGVTGSWTPSVRLPALTGSAIGQNYVSADWAVKGSTTWNTFNLTAGDLDGGDFTSTATNAPSTVAGSDIIIRIVIANVNYEILTAQAIKIGVDGTMPGNVNDIKSVTDCANADVFAKEGTFTVTARPEVIDATTNTPNTTDFITKNP